MFSGTQLAVLHPDRDWGAALDGHELGDLATIYTAKNVAAMKTAGLKPISYRLRTELGIETWHWNPAGHWSDAVHHQGYWISDPHSDAPIDVTFGYRLPRRGRTVDDADNTGYSRIDDGDTATYWKSNPYLDPRYTHDPESEHPQWFVVDFARPSRISEIRLLWGAPFPRRYRIEYWTGDQSQPIDYNPDGAWRLFEHGLVSNERGGSRNLVLTGTPVTTRALRVTMFESSHTASGGTGDPRDSLGFALREVFAGDRDRGGAFRDAIRHGATAAGQTAMLVSSTDPWHREIDRDSSTAQPGFDMLVQSGLTDRLPMLVPTGLLFDTPENAAAELRFLEGRGYPLRGIELGEEPDGQRVTPEDYGSLYLQFATALHAVDPRMRVGGPSAQTLYNDPLNLWPARNPPGRRTTWIGRFLDYIDAHGRTADFNFYSFEWYPFNPVCGDTTDRVAEAPGLLARRLEALRRAGLADSIPRIMAEYGFSAHITAAEVDLPGALFDADAVATFFARGGSRSFLFGYEPGKLGHDTDCPDRANLSMFIADRAGQAQYRTPRYYGTRLLTKAWADSNGGSHTMYATRVELPGATIDTMVGAFALHRPDGRWSLLVINRDRAAARTIDVQIAPPSGQERRDLRGPIDVWQYSAEQYRFLDQGNQSRPARDLPPVHRSDATTATTTLPPYSITVIVGW